jgi:hypothetical protein
MVKDFGAQIVFYRVSAEMNAFFARLHVCAISGSDFAHGR